MFPEKNYHSQIKTTVVSADVMYSFTLLCKIEDEELC